MVTEQSRVTGHESLGTDITSLIRDGTRDSVRATSGAAAIHCPTTLTARSSPALGYPRADSGGHRWPGSAGRGAARTDAQHPSVVRADARVAAPPLTATLGPANSASLTAVRPPSPHRPRHSADQSNCCRRSLIIRSCCGRLNIQPG